MKVKKHFLFYSYYKEINVYDAYNIIINMNNYNCPREIKIEEIEKKIIDISEQELINIKCYVESIEEEIRSFAYDNYNLSYKELSKNIKKKCDWLNKKSIERLISQGKYAAK